MIQYTGAYIPSCSSINTHHYCQNLSLCRYVGASEPMPLLVRFLEGFAQHAVLNTAECAALPDLINLRVLHNCVYFVGRAITGEDTIDTLTTRANMYAERIIWVRKHEKEIVATISDLMRSKDHSL